MSRSSHTRIEKRKADAPKPTVAFAYMPSRFSKAAASEGIFRLRRISAFHTMENGFLRDPLDGIAFSESTSFNLGELNSDQRAAVAKWNVGDFGPEVAFDPRNFDVIDCQFQLSSVNYFTLCASKSGSNAHLSAIHDGLVKILDVSKFTEAIAESHALDIVDWVHGDVVYTDAGIDPLSNAQIDIALRKRTIFAPEEEHRMLWGPREGAPDELMTRSPAAARFLRYIR